MNIALTYQFWVLIKHEADGGDKDSVSVGCVDKISSFSFSWSPRELEKKQSDSSD